MVFRIIKPFKLKKWNIGHPGGRALLTSKLERQLKIRRWSRGQRGKAVSEFLKLDGK